MAQHRRPSLTHIEARILNSLDDAAAARDRAAALLCAIKGAVVANPAERAGLIQLAEDVIQGIAEIEENLRSKIYS